MTDYNARIELATRDDSTLPDTLIDALPGYGPAVARSERGWVELHITFPAADLRQAATTALALVASATPLDVVALEVLTTAEFDARNGLAPTPEYLGVPDVARALGVSPQAVRQRIATGSIPATKKGRDWLVQRTIVDNLTRATYAGVRVQAQHTLRGHCDQHPDHIETMTRLDLANGEEVWLCERSGQPVQGEVAQ